MKLQKTTLLILSTLLLFPQWATADDDEWEHRSYKIKGPGSLLYRKECGSCHIAYPPRFLGKSSWKRMMKTLEDHFGENAELEAKEQQQITQYLVENSSNSRWYKFWNKQGEARAPLRITETRAFRHEHDEIPRSFVLKNEKILSLSQCDSCHINAAEGNFSEHQIHIPGIGRWEDD